MIDILAYIDTKMTELEIPYEFGEWNAAVTYPYFVGSYQESDFRFEDNCTSGVFTLDGWSRGSKITLIEAVDKIKAAFADMQEIVNNRSFFIRYGGANTIPSGEADLYRVTITLFTYEWEGE